MNKFAECHINTKREYIEELLAEIKSEGYTTINQIRGSLYGTLDALRLAELQEEGLQYEAEAKADHFTSEQF